MCIFFSPSKASECICTVCVENFFMKIWIRPVEALEINAKLCHKEMSRSVNHSGMCNVYNTSRGYFTMKFYTFCIALNREQF